MECNQGRELISLYIDEELKGIEKIEFELHIKECNQCLQEVKAMAELVKQCNSIPEVEIPEDFNLQLRSKLMEAVKEQQLDEEKQSKQLDIYSPKRKIDFAKRITKINWKIGASVAAVLLIAIIGISSLDAIKFTEDINYDNYGMMSKSESMDREARNNYNTSDAGNRGTITLNDSAEEAKVTLTNEATLTGQLNQSSVYTNSDSTESQNSSRERKLIKNASITLEVDNYSDITKTVTNYIVEQEGFIQYSNESNIKEYNQGKEINRKQGYYTIRIPKYTFESSLVFFEGLGQLLDRTIGGNDITYNYYDLETKAKNLIIQEERIREILTKADKIEDILALERELNRIRTDIEGIYSTLKGWDDQVDFATIQLNIVEKRPLQQSIQPIDSTLWQKTKAAFVASINSIVKGMERLVIKLGSIIPWLFIIALVVIVLYSFMKTKKKTKKD